MDPFATHRELGTAEEVVGRDDALDAVRRVLETARRGPAGLVLEGEPGIGKTSVWRAGLDTAGEGFEALVARPAESESALPYVALGDLLGRLTDDELSAVPDPQRVAVEIALLRRASDAVAPSRRAVALAVLAIVRSRAATRPVLLGVDDLQWLDPESAEVLRFVLRRLDHEPVALLATERREPGVAPTPLEVAGRAVERLRLDSLVAGPLRHLLGRRFGAHLDRPTFHRVYEATDGNPLFAIEMTRALLSRPSMPAPGDPLPVPHDLRMLLRDRLASIPSDVREVLEAISAMFQPTAPLVCEVLDEEGAAALSAAADLGLLETDPDRLRFSHPLLGSVVYGELAPPDRRMLHARLATVERQPEARARHLALSSEGPDEAIAGELERTANETGAVLAPATAGELMELAFSLTPTALAQERARRARLAGHFLFFSGETERGRRLTEMAVDIAPRGRERVLALWRLTVIRSYQDGSSFTLTDELLEEMRDDPEMRLQLHDALSRSDSHTATESYGHSEEAERLAQELGNRDALVSPITTAVSNAILMGGGVDEERFVRALELQEFVLRTNRTMRAITYPAVIFAWVLAYVAEPSRARPLLQRAWEITRDLGDDSTEPYLHFTEARISLVEGRLVDAATAAAACRRTAEDLGQDAASVLAKPIAAVALAMEGRLREAATAAAEAIEGIRRFGQRIPLSDALFAGAAVELWSGRAAQAMGLFREGLDVHDQRGLGDPALFQFRGNLIEALLTNGLVDEAAAQARWLEEHGREVHRAWAVAVGARSNGQVAAAKGTLDEAARLTALAVEHARVLEMPIELGRSLLTHGRTLRRLKRKRPAREALEEAEPSSRRAAPACGRTPSDASSLGSEAGRRPRWISRRRSATSPPWLRAGAATRRSRRSSS